MSISKTILIGSISLFAIIGVLALEKKNKEEKGDSSKITATVEEVVENSTAQIEIRSDTSFLVKLSERLSLLTESR